MPDDNYSLKPLIWAIVNIVVVILSLSLAVHILDADDDRRERPGAIAEHLLYNFATTVIWFAQVVSNTYDIWKHQIRHSKIMVVVEWIICIYCIWDSAHLLMRLRLNNDDLGIGFLEAVYGIGFYSYMFVVSFHDYRESLPKRRYQSISNVRLDSNFLNPEED